MADVTLSQTCSSLEPLSKTCRLTGMACTFLDRPRACPDSTFVAKVSMPPDEFNVLLDAQDRPALGALSIKRCRRPEVHTGVAGVHVNVILETVGTEAFLEMTWHADGSVEYVCPATEVRFLWREGAFIPL
jgi:hypothetical protein